LRKAQRVRNFNQYKKGIKKTAERDRFFQNNCLHCNFLFLMVLTGRDEEKKLPWLVS
jgi:hypothetical protein